MLEIKGTKEEIEDFFETMSTCIGDTCFKELCEGCFDPKGCKGCILSNTKLNILVTETNNRIKKLTYVGEDSWGRPVYIDENGKYWKDTDNRKDWLSDRNICSSVRNAFDGEPDCPISPYFTLEFIPERIVR